MDACRHEGEAAVAPWAVEPVEPPMLPPILRRETRLLIKNIFKYIYFFFSKKTSLLRRETRFFIKTFLDIILFDFFFSRKKMSLVGLEPEHVGKEVGDSC